MTAHQSISQSAAKTFTVVDLVAEALKGRIRIPEFQRPLRWQWEDVRRLFDSIVKGYPIGNLLAGAVAGHRIPARWCWRASFCLPPLSLPLGGVDPVFRSLPGTESA